MPLTPHGFEEIREFARTLNQKRQQVSDAQLLDQCQQHLDALVAELADNFEEAAHEEAAAPEPGHSGQGPKLESNFDEPQSWNPPPAPAEPEPHHPRPHAVPHKKAPTKKHR